MLDTIRNFYILEGDIQDFCDDISNIIEYYGLDEEEEWE